MSIKDFALGVGSEGLNSYSGNVVESSSIIEGLGRLTAVNFWGRRT